MYSTNINWPKLSKSEILHIANQKACCIETYFTHISHTKSFNTSVSILSTSYRIPTRGQLEKGSHAYFLLQVFWVILLFDINVVRMPTIVTWCHNSTIWHHNSSTMPTIKRKNTWLPLLLLPPSGYSIWGTENWTYLTCSYVKWVRNVSQYNILSDFHYYFWE